MTKIPVLQVHFDKYSFRWIFNVFIDCAASAIGLYRHCNAIKLSAAPENQITFLRYDQKPDDPPMTPRRQTTGRTANKKSLRAGPTAANSARDTNELAAEVLGRFREVFRAAKLHFAAVQKIAGVSGAQLWALSEINAQPGLRVSDLTQKMSLHQSTVSNLVEKLDSVGLLRRVREDGDNRVVRLQLTSAGKKVVARAPEPARGVLPDALEQLDERSLKKLSSSLESLVKQMKVRAPGATKTHLENI
jgi:DNA-binding MarR family transcriptional regulator